MNNSRSSTFVAAVMLASACVVAAAQSPTVLQRAAPPQVVPPQATLQQAAPQSAPTPGCSVSGTVTAGQAKLPGATVTVAPKGGGTSISTSTGLDGTFRVHPAGPGTYDVRAELSAFVSVVKTITLGTDCQAVVDLTATLRSRAPAAAGQAATPPAPAAGQARPRTGSLAGLLQQFQRVAPIAGAQAGQQGQAAGTTGGGAEDTAAVAQHLNLPAGFTAESVSESVTTFGSSTQTNTNLLFGGRGSAGPGGAGGAMAAVGDSQPGQVSLPGMGQTGGGFSAGAFGLAGVNVGGRGGGGGLANLAGLAGMAGVVGMVGGIPGVGNLQGSRISGQAAYTFGGSMLNAQPYALNGQTPQQPNYVNQRYSVAIGGPAKIPGLFDLGTRSSAFLNYAGGHGSNLFESYSRVPSLAFRAGDFSSLSTSVRDPLTGLPFPGNQIPANRINPSAAALLRYYPLPNQPESAQNYHLSGTTVSNSDDINVRFARTFGTIQLGRLISAVGRNMGRGAASGGAAGGRGTAGAGASAGGTGGMLGALDNMVNLNVGLHFSRSDSSQLTAFPGLQGNTHRSGWDVPVNVSFGKWGLLNTVSVQFNRNRSTTTNQFGGVTDVAGDAGVAGASTDPFDWGVPTLSFSSVSSLHDVTPSESLNQSITVTGWMMKLDGKHTMRWGGDFKALLSENRNNSNARGSFVFTGLYTGGAGGPTATGLDFADFLLGMPQQASLQIGPGLERFHAHGFSLYFQDDWRMTGNITLNLGLRYEYQSPYTEADNRLVTLDVPSDFVSATSVRAGQSGPYGGAYPLTIVRPDRNNIAPRLGFAWRASQKTTVRGGYGINYASVPYMSMAQKLAAQPPFAVTNTAIGGAGAPLAIGSVFAVPPSASTTTNTFGVDPNYGIGYVQIWNVDVQRELARTWTVGLTYTGTKGSSLDLLRAPNRGPAGLRIPNVQAFTWESSGSKSMMNALSVRIRKRLSFGVSGGVTYTLSKSMDNASSVGGGGGVVAQDDRNLAAEWGRSSFDQRHQISGDFAIELPLGVGRKWVTNEGVWDKIVGGWMVNGNVSWGSGTPFTARILAAASDISRGTNGTLRADYTGQPIALSNPTIAMFFNTAAFALPAAGTFGNSSRNTINGPANTTINMSMSKSLRFMKTRSVSVRIQANNVLNTPQWGSIDTVVNSPTFGRVLSVRPMRSVQIIARVSF